MFRKLFSAIFGGKAGNVPFSANRIEGERPGAGGIVISRNVDDLSEDALETFGAVASQHTKIPVFNGHVEYGYAFDVVADKDHCPRCGSDVELRYANFVYVTQIALRVMYAPAGLFCSRCPTVSVNEAIIRSGIADNQHHYKQVVGIDYGGKKEADYFTKWNGNDLVYVFDEDKNLLDVTTTPPADATIIMSRQADHRKSKKAKRKKQEKKARKRNRKK